MDLLPLQYERIVRAALEEDIGGGDITTTLCIPAETKANALIVSKSPGIIAGIDVAAAAFRMLDPEIRWEQILPDGTRVGTAITPLAQVSGNARAILTAERVALNLIQRMSGVASLTAKYVALVAGTNARIVDTRKTTPGLRVLEKYAVRVGGGYNHRLGLYDCILIKDNHIQAAGSIENAVSTARAKISHTMKIEVEADTLDQVSQALACGADIILLDNMDIATLKQAVNLLRGRAISEASGGLNESTVAAVAATGVDILSIGALTHSAPALDIGLDFRE
jgi:nicotinate-nucleotide pyrophosphorylase (carboxylating)